MCSRPVGPHAGEDPLARAGAWVSAAASESGKNRTSGSRERDPHAPHDQGLRGRAGGPRDARGAARAGRWAPNHHLTNPWRFRVVGPRALEALKRRRRGAGQGDGAGRARTSRSSGASRRRSSTAPRRWSWCSAKHSADPVQDEEDAHATGVRGVQRAAGRPRARSGRLLAHARRCCGPRPAPRPSACPGTSASSGCCTSATRARRPRRPERAPVEDYATFLD